MENSRSRIGRAPGRPSCYSSDRPSLLLLFLCDARIQEDPAQNKEDPPNGRGYTDKRAMGALSNSQGSKGIQRTAEQDDPHNKTVARPDHPLIMDLAGQKGHDKERKSMIELIAHAGLEDGHDIGTCHRPELGGGKGAEGNKQNAQQGRDREKVSVHSS